MWDELTFLSPRKAGRGASGEGQFRSDAAVTVLS